VAVKVDASDWCALCIDLPASKQYIALMFRIIALKLKSALVEIAPVKYPSNYGFITSIHNDNLFMIHSHQSLGPIDAPSL
jgi:hypothetical protein